MVYSAGRGADCSFLPESGEESTAKAIKNSCMFMGLSSSAFRAGKFTVFSYDIEPAKPGFNGFRGLGIKFRVSLTQY